MDNVGRVVCFGETLLRLSAPDSELLLQSARLDARFGGAETNVAVSLARFGHEARMLTVLPDNAIGEAALGELRRHGVDTRFLQRRAGRMGLYFLTPGAVRRPSDVLYDRAGSAFAETAASDFAFEAALEGCDWLHLSGITPAVGARSAEAALEAVRTARALGVKVSFDGNHRARMWASWNGDARAVLRELIAAADLLFGNERDLGLVLDRAFDAADRLQRRRDAAHAAFEAFPRLQRIVSTFRDEQGATAQALSGLLITRTGEASTETAQLHGVVDRIGTGDAFAAGVLHGLLRDLGDAGALAFGMAAAVFKHSVPGDFNLASEADIVAAMADPSVHVRR